MPWLYLALAIGLEVVSTTFLKASEGFTRPVPTLLVLLGYSGAFYFLSLALKVIPLGIAYAIWAGLGIAAIAVMGRLVYSQKLTGPALFGIGLILAGVLVLNLSTSPAEKKSKGASGPEPWLDLFHRIRSANIQFSEELDFASIAPKDAEQRVDQ
jgi:multidrug transporter EmrE-like cation transporter